MSRFENKLLPLKEGVSLQIQSNLVKVKGPKGELAFKVPKEVKISQKDDGILILTKDKKIKKHFVSAFIGMTYKIIQNLMIGVTEGFKRELEINGVGYRWVFANKKLTMSLGFSHPIEYNISRGH